MTKTWMMRSLGVENEELGWLADLFANKILTITVVMRLIKL